MPNQTNLAQLEPTFQIILEQRMADVPIINDRLTVKAIGFQQWHGYQLGVLVTPWFMNVILLPEIERDAEQPQIGSKKIHVFPSGAYEFIVGFENGLGIYHSCSLFSPMFQFEDQAAAELTAEEALSAMMNEENTDTTSQVRDSEIAQIWAGDAPAPDKTDSLFARQDHVEETEKHKLLSERIKESTSRRDFLRGKVFTEGADK